MNTSEIVIFVVGILVMLSAIFRLGINARKNRWIIALIGETGLRVLIFILGAVFSYLAMFTDYFVS